ASEKVTWQHFNLDARTNVLLHRLNVATVALEEWLRSAARKGWLPARPRTLLLSIYRPLRRLRVIYPAPPSAPQAPPALDDEEICLLRALVHASPRLLKQKGLQKVAADMPEGMLLSRGTIPARLIRLARLDLIHQPKGPRKGYAATERGAQFVR